MIGTKLLRHTLFVCLIATVQWTYASEPEEFVLPELNGPLRMAALDPVEEPSEVPDLETDGDSSATTLTPAVEATDKPVATAKTTIESTDTEKTTGPENPSETKESADQAEAQPLETSNPTKGESTKERASKTETKTGDQGEQAKTESEPPKPTAPPKPKLSPQMRQLQARVQRTLDFYLTRQLNTRDDSPWSIMHALIGFGVDTHIRVGGPRGREVNAISWLCGNGTCSGVKLLHVRNGQLGVTLGPGFQGHEGQLLAMLAQSRVMIDYPILVSGERLSVVDLIEYEQLNCRPKSELTFRLIGLSHYLDSDQTWKDKHGNDWDIQKLIREELAQPINGVTCGGTHRLMGFSYSVRKRQQSGRPVTGQWKRAEKYVNDYHRYTFGLQNRDGSFSTAYFRHRENRNDINRRLETTGHILEWLVFSLPSENLDDPQTVRAVTYLSNLMYMHRNAKLPVGPLGHAIRSLVLYEERVFGTRPGQRHVQLAKRRAQTRRR